MVERTSTIDAPWTLVEGNSKRYGRLKVLRTVANALEQALDEPKAKGRNKKRKKKR